MGLRLCALRAAARPTETTAATGEVNAPLSVYQPVPTTESVPAGRNLQRFRSAVRRVIRLLALRKKWAAYGKVLQEPPRCKLWEGLERRKGVLKRVKKLVSP